MAVITDVNNTYVRVKESDRNIFYIKKADVSKAFLKDSYISVIGNRGEEVYKIFWELVDVYDEETSSYVVHNSDTLTTEEDTLVAVHNAFFFRDGVGIDLEQLSNIEGQSADGYILVYDAEIQKWTPQPVMFNTDEAADLSSNVSGLSRGRLQLAIATDTETGIQYRQLLFNDVSGVQHTIPLPSDLTETGQQESLTVVCRNADTVTIGAGMPVHFTGTQGVNSIEFIYADANDPDRMPAHGILSTQTTQNGSNGVVVFGTVDSLNTEAIEVDPNKYPDGLEEGMTVYVRPGGGMTTTRPTSASHFVQNIGQIESVNSSNGKVLVTGPGRSNDIPNLANKNVFIGNATGPYEARQLNTDDISQQANATNKFFSDALARAAIKAAQNSNITYNQGTGAIGIDDSSYLTSIDPADVQNALTAGDGISLNAGTISIDLVGPLLQINEAGALTIADLNTIDVSTFNNDAGYLTASDLDSFGAQVFESDIVANMPTIAGVVKTFGKYKNGDTIPAAGRTPLEVITNALQDAINPSPDISSVSQPDFGQKTGTITVTFNFGIQNNGSDGTAILRYKFGTAGTYSTVATYDETDVFYGADNKTFSYSFSETFNENNKYYFELIVTENNVSLSAQSDERYSTPHGYNAPLIDELENNQVNTGVASGTTNTFREVGDVETEFVYDVRRDEAIVGLYYSVIQYKNGNTWTTISGSQYDGIDDLANGSTETAITFNFNGSVNATITDVSSDTSQEFRVNVVSDEIPDQGGRKYTQEEFSPINFTHAYVICAGPYYTEQPTAAQIQAVFDTRTPTTNGFSEYRIRSGSYPSNIGTTEGIIEQSGNSLYIIYPGTGSISNILLDGSIPVLGTFQNWGTYSLQNQFGITSQYTVYMSGPSAFGANGAQTLTIS
jgi:hypothetical protein